MSDFDGIDRSTMAHLAGTAGPAPLTIELIRQGFARMMAWRPPPPMPLYITDDVGAIIWSRYRDEVAQLRARGLAGDAMARELAMTTMLGHEMALGFVAWMETAQERARIHGDTTAISRVVAELSAERAHPVVAPRGMTRPWNLRAKPAPPMPPWARERRRHR